MKISVIIPCYNSGETLGEQLEALANQKFPPPWEVIIADNGSTDDTLEVARSFRNRLPELVIVDASGRRGAAYARNRGVDAARSDFVAFCDSDDVVGDGYLEAVVRALETCEFIGGRYEYGKLNRRWISRLPGVQQTDVDCGMLGPFKYAGGGSLAVRKSAHELIGGFDEEDFPVLQDTDYCVRMQREGVWLHFAPDAVVHYRWRETVPAAFRQARNWGRDVVALRVRYWPVELPIETPRSFVRSFRELARIRNSRELAYWIWATGWRLGTIDGWREQTRKNGFPKPETGFSQRLAAVAGRLISRWERFSDEACSEAMRFGFARLDESSRLEYPLKLDGREHMHIGADVQIGSGGWLYAVSRYGEQEFEPEIRIGNGSSIGLCCHIVAVRKVSVGKNVSIGNRVYLSDNLHDYRDVRKPIVANRLISCGEVVIGDGCTIGDGACVIGDVRMGEGSVLEANSVLTKSLPPRAVASGIPARIVSRFNSESQRWEVPEPGGSSLKNKGFAAGSSDVPAF